MCDQIARRPQACRPAPITAIGHMRTKLRLRLVQAIAHVAAMAPAACGAKRPPAAAAAASLDGLRSALPPRAPSPGASTARAPRRARLCDGEARPARVRGGVTACRPRRRRSKRQGPRRPRAASPPRAAAALRRRGRGRSPCGWQRVVARSPKCRLREGRARGGKSSPHLC